MSEQTEVIGHNTVLIRTVTSLKTQEHVGVEIVVNGKTFSVDDTTSASLKGLRVGCIHPEYDEELLYQTIYDRSIQEVAGERAEVCEFCGHEEVLNVSNVTQQGGE